MLRFLSDPQSRKLHFLLYKVFSKKIPFFHIGILLKNHKKMPTAHKKPQKTAIFICIPRGGGLGEYILISISIYYY